MKSIEIAITQEEITIVSRLSQGEKAELIGANLGYAQGTFATKMQQIRNKYGVKNTPHLVAFFLREGIVKWKPMIIITALTVVLFGLVLFLAIPKIKERDKIKRQEKIWDENSYN